MTASELNLLRAAWIRASTPLSGAAFAQERGWVTSAELAELERAHRDARAAYAEALAEARRAPAWFAGWVETLYVDDDTPTLRRRKRDMKHGVWWDWCARSGPGFTPTVQVRDEAPGDAVEALVEAAFGQVDEARLVERLRPRPDTISLVAEIGGAVVGHVMLSAVEVEGRPTRAGALAPLAVREPFRGRAVGSALTQAGLDRLWAQDRDLCFVLGDPEYYRGLGFVPAAPRWRSPWPGAEAAFQVTYRSWGLADAYPGGTVRYDPAFDALG